MQLHKKCFLLLLQLNKKLINLKNMTSLSHGLYKCGQMDYGTYSELRSDKSETHNAFLNYHSQIEKDIQVNRKRFFGYMNDKLKANAFPSNIQYIDV